MGHKKAVFTFGRLNPPTKGHHHLIKWGVNLANETHADYFLFPSPSVDKIPKSGIIDPHKSKNPLPFPTKVALLRRLFPTINIVEELSVYSPQQVIEYLGSRGYVDLAFVVGSDRVETFKVRWLPYALEEIETARVVSAGARDPDADGIEGMSASKARACVIEDDFEGFAQAVGWRNREFMSELYTELREGMGLSGSRTINRRTNESV